MRHGAISHGVPWLSLGEHGTTGQPSIGAAVMTLRPNRRHVPGRRPRWTTRSCATSAMCDTSRDPHAQQRGSWAHPCGPARQPPVPALAYGRVASWSNSGDRHKSCVASGLTVMPAGLPIQTPAAGKAAATVAPRRDARPPPEGSRQHAGP